jgi:hypothetical protein
VLWRAPPTLRAARGPGLVQWRILGRKNHTEMADRVTSGEQQGQGVAAAKGCRRRESRRTGEPPGESGYLSGDSKVSTEVFVSSTPLRSRFRGSRNTVGWVETAEIDEDGLVFSGSRSLGGPGFWLLGLTRKPHLAQKQQGVNSWCLRFAQLPLCLAHVRPKGRSRRDCRRQQAERLTLFGWSGWLKGRGQFWAPLIVTG